MTWRPFVRYWPLERGIHRSPIDSPHKEPARPAFMFHIRLYTLLNKQSCCRWFETLRGSYDVTIMNSSKCERSSMGTDMLTRFFNLDRMMTSSNGNIFRVAGPLCGEFTGPGEFPAQRPVTRSFDVFFDLRLSKRLSKQPWDWWFETPAWSLWRHRNGDMNDSGSKQPEQWDRSQVTDLFRELHRK